MSDERDFQQRVRKIGELVQQLETVADPAVRDSAKELLQLSMDLHGAGLERMLEIIFQSHEAGPGIIDELGRDSLVSSLLILYGIHPEELQTRVERKLQEIESKLHKMGVGASLLGCANGDVRVRIQVDGHACGSTARTAQSTVEEAIYEAAPDLKSLVIEGGEQPAGSGFVALENLVAGPNRSGFPVSAMASAGRINDPAYHE